MENYTPPEFHLTQPKKIAETYSQLPPEKLEQIKNRDNNNQP